jgi:hypothetical protein
MWLGAGMEVDVGISANRHAGRDALPAIHAFWVGRELGPLHAACLRSFVKHGHKTTLHVYDTPIDVPGGVELADASRLMKDTEIIRHKKTGSLAIASDIFRYRILTEGLGVYVDCDVFCLKPVKYRKYLMGWQDDTLVCSAILAAPPNSDLVRFLADASNDPTFIPPWIKPWKRKTLLIRKAIGIPQKVTTMRWGVIGPTLLTHAIKKFGLENETQPIDVFYPLAPKHRPLLKRPGLRLLDLATPNSEVIHLWNSRFDYQTVPQGSPLDEILKL